MDCIFGTLNATFDGVRSSIGVDLLARTSWNYNREGGDLSLTTVADIVGVEKGDSACKLLACMVSLRRSQTTP
jgi:hypothetical protein